MTHLEHNLEETTQKHTIGAGANGAARGSVSPAYVYRLWDYQSLLTHRAKRSAGTERLHLLRQVDEVKQNIARCCGKEPLDFDELKRLMGGDR